MITPLSANSLDTSPMRRMFSSRSSAAQGWHSGCQAWCGGGVSVRQTVDSTPTKMAHAKPLNRSNQFNGAAPHPPFCLAVSPHR